MMKYILSSLLLMSGMAFYAHAYADAFGVFRPTHPAFYLDWDGDGTWSGDDLISPFGLSGDLPVAGDWNGDGYDEIGIFRPTHPAFYLDWDGNGIWSGDDLISPFGLSGDLPVAGDWNGDGYDEIGVFRPANGTFYLDWDGNGTWSGGDIIIPFAVFGDLPVAGDWNNDGFDEIGVFRPAAQTFYLDWDGNGLWGSGDVIAPFGLSGDLPIAGDWNDDGYDEVGVFRPANVTFYLDWDGNGLWSGGDVIAPFGLPGDLPVAGNWGLSSPSTCEQEEGSDFDAGYFKIMVIADSHVDGDAGGGSNWDELEHIVINLQDPDGVNEYMNIHRVVVVGDVVSAAFDRTRTFSRIEKAKEIMDRLWDTYRGPVPYTFVMGNHDYKLDNDDDSDRMFLPNEILAAERRWVNQMQRFPAQPWKPYWQQIQSGWKFIYLDSFRGNTLPRFPNEKFRHFDEAQIDWLDCELASGHKTLIFMHHPVATDDVDDLWWAYPRDVIDEMSDPDFMNLMYWYRDRVEAIFVGHGHHFMEDKLYNEIKVKEVGSIAEPTPDCDHPKFIVEGRPIGYDGLRAPIVEIERECQ